MTSFLGDNKAEYFKLSFFMFFIWSAYSFIFSFFPIWLSQSVGLSGTETGIVFSVQSLIALLFQPLFGLLQDKLGLRKHLIYTINSLLVLCAPFLIFFYKPLLAENVIAGAIAGGIYFSLIIYAGGGLIESYAERSARSFNGEFGKIRMWASLGWAFATFNVGILISINESMVFWLGSISAMIALCIAITISNLSDEQAKTTPTDKITLADTKALVSSKNFFCFALYVVGVSSVYSIYDQQFPIYFTSLFGSLDEGNKMFGYLNSSQVFLEALGMFCAPYLVNKIGAKNGLMLAGVIMIFRIAMSALIDSTIALSILKLVHAAELPILVVSVFKYINNVFPQKLTSTMYLFGYLFMTQIAATIFSTFFGVLYDNIGFPSTYLVMASIILAFLIFSFLLLPNSASEDDDNINQPQVNAE